MPRTTPSLTVADFLHGYLTLTSLDALSLATPDPDIADLDLPAAADLPRRLMDDGAEMTLPQITIRADESGATGAHRVVNVDIKLCTTLRLAATDATSLTRCHTRAAADELIDIIDRRLRHRDALSAYLATLDATERDGWTILKHRVTRAANVDRDEAKLPPNALILALEAVFNLAWSR
jgi:hypothetical protein